MNHNQMFGQQTKFLPVSDGLKQSDAHFNLLISIVLEPAAAIRTFHGLRKKLRSRNVQIQAKFTLYKTLILPVKASTLKEVVRKIFEVFEQTAVLVGK